MIIINVLTKDLPAEILKSSWHKEFAKAQARLQAEDKRLSDVYTKRQRDWEAARKKHERDATDSVRAGNGVPPRPEVGEEQARLNLWIQELRGQARELRSAYRAAQVEHRDEIAAAFATEHAAIDRRVAPLLERVINDLGPSLDHANRLLAAEHAFKSAVHRHTHGAGTPHVRRQYRDEIELLRGVPPQEVRPQPPRPQLAPTPPPPPPPTGHVSASNPVTSRLGARR